MLKEAVAAVRHVKRGGKEAAAEYGKGARGTSLQLLFFFWRRDYLQAQPDRYAEEVERAWQQVGYQSEHVAHLYHIYM